MALKPNRRNVRKFTAIFVQIFELNDNVYHMLSPMWCKTQFWINAG